MRQARTTTQLPTTRAPRGPATDSNGEGYVTHMVVPPDGGWGWVIVAASFFANMLEGAVIYSVGSYTVPFIVQFDASTSAIAFVGSLVSGFHQIVGPIVSAMCNRWGFRVVMILGSIVSAVGIALCSLATELWHIYLLFGVVAGVGTCLIFMPGAVIVTFYFVRWRALAVCISLCGAGVGGAIFPLMLDYWIAQFGWRSGTLFEGGLLLTGVVAGLLYRPIEPVAVRVTEAAGRTSISGLRRHSLVPNAKYPTAADAYSVSRATVNSLQLARSSSNASVMIVPMEYYDNPVRDAGSEHIIVMNIVQPPKQTRCRVCLGRFCCCCKRRRRRRGVLGIRPMYRDDIFYEASIKSMRSRVSHLSVSAGGAETGAEFAMTMTRLPTERDIEQEESRRCMLCPEAATRILATMVDCSLLRSPSFLLLVLQGCLMQSVLLLPFMYAQERARAHGVDAETIKYLVTSISASGILLRIVSGVVASVPRVSVFAVSAVGLALGGLGLLLISVSTEPAFQFAVCAAFGGALACYFALRSVVIVELLGLEKLTNAFGLLLLFQGGASTLGPPLVGATKDLTGEYDTMFYISGACILLSALVMALLPTVNRCERARAASRRQR